MAPLLIAQGARAAELVEQVRATPTREVAVVLLDPDPLPPAQAAELGALSVLVIVRDVDPATGLSSILAACPRAVVVDLSVAVDPESSTEEWIELFALLHHNPDTGRTYV